MKSFLAILCLTGCVQHLTPVERAKIDLANIYRVTAKVENNIRPEREEINDAINTMGDIKQAEPR